MQEEELDLTEEDIEFDKLEGREPEVDLEAEGVGEKRELGPNAEVVTELLGSEKWMTYPNTQGLANLPEEELRDRAANLTAILESDNWKGRPAFLTSLSKTLKLNAEHLTEILGGEHWKKWPGLLTRPPETQDDHAEFLTELIGSDSWKNYCPYLLGRAKVTLGRRGEYLTALLEGDQWKRGPNLLGLSRGTIEGHAAFLTQLVGSTKWKTHPQLLFHAPGTLRSYAEHLTEVVGGAQWKTHPNLLTLPPETQDSKAAFLNKLIGNTKWKKRAVQLLGRDPDTLKGRVGYLEELVGARWRDWPVLLAKDPEVIKAKARNLDEIFGSYDWKVSAQLLDRSTKTLRRNAVNHTRQFGSDQWLKEPTLIGVTSRTFNSSLNALETLGFTPETKEAETIKMLATTMETKRIKARLIRQHILHHKHVYLFEESIPLGEYVDFRASFTSEEKEEERREIEEFVEFLHENPDILTWSPVRILSWGKRRGYIEMAEGEKDTPGPNAELLDQLLESEQWRRQESARPLSRWPAEVLKERARNLDEIFGKYSWKEAPALLKGDPDTMKKVAADHTEHYGSERWLKKPTLVRVSPGTFNASLEALETLGFTPETSGSILLELISTTTSTKRSKARLIRERILHHKHVYLFDENISLGEYVKFRASLTPEEKEEEKREVEEFVGFLHKNPKILRWGEKRIIKWGVVQRQHRQQHGPPSSDISSAWS